MSCLDFKFIFDDNNNICAPGFLFQGGQMMIDSEYKNIYIKYYFYDEPLPIGEITDIRGDIIIGKLNNGQTIKLKINESNN